MWYSTGLNVTKSIQKHILHAGIGVTGAQQASKVGEGACNFVKGS